MLRKGLGFLVGVAILLCLLAADLEPYRGLVAKYGTGITSPDALRFIAANVSEPYSVGTSPNQFRLTIFCDGCEAQQPEGLRETVLYNETVDGIVFSLYSYDADHEMREFAQRTLFLVARYNSQLSYLELPSSEMFGYCQQQSRLAKVSHPFKNSIWVELMIPSTGDCDLRFGGRQTMRYGVLLNVEEGGLKTLLDAVPVQQTELSWVDAESEILRLQIAFGENAVEIMPGSKNVSQQQESWIGTYQVK
jgi:hypothetical protein